MKKIITRSFFLNLKFIFTLVMRQFKIFISKKKEEKKKLEKKIPLQTYFITETSYRTNKYVNYINDFFKIKFYNYMLYIYIL